MSKHQSCFICKRDFIGPDSCIGNLCPECDADVHRDCHQSISHLETTVANKEVEIRRLSEVACEIALAWCKNEELSAHQELLAEFIADPVATRHAALSQFHPEEQTT